MAPKRPPSTACFSSCSVGLRRFCLTTNSLTPASRQPRTIAMPSSHLVAMGFSVSTWRPACAAPHGLARVQAAGRGQHDDVGVAALAIGGEQRVERGEAARAGPGHRGLQRLGRLSHTATSSARPACWRRASTWLAEMRPQPTSAKRIGRSTIGKGAGIGGRRKSRRLFCTLGARLKLQQFQ
jgi:hypothetical protein